MAMNNADKSGKYGTINPKPSDGGVASVISNFAAKEAQQRKDDYHMRATTEKWILKPRTEASYEQAYWNEFDKLAARNGKTELQLRRQLNRINQDLRSYGMEQINFSGNINEVANVARFQTSTPFIEMEVQAQGGRAKAVANMTGRKESYVKGIETKVNNRIEEEFGFRMEIPISRLKTMVGEGANESIEKFIEQIRKNPESTFKTEGYTFNNPELNDYLRERREYLEEVEQEAKAQSTKKPQESIRSGKSDDAAWAEIVAAITAKAKGNGWDAVVVSGFGATEETHYFNDEIASLIRFLETEMINSKNGRISMKEALIEAWKQGKRAWLNEIRYMYYEDAKEGSDVMRGDYSRGDIFIQSQNEFGDKVATRNDQIDRTVDGIRSRLEMYEQSELYKAQSREVREL
jgi:hypothetical protein